jgi:hypothetical protein
MIMELLKSARNYVESMAGKSVFAKNLLCKIDEYLEKPLPEPVAGVAMRDGQPTLVKIGTEDTYEGRLYAEPKEISSDKAIVKDGLIKWLSKHASSDFNVFYSGENWDASMLIDEINAESEVGKNFVSGFADLTIDLLFRKKEALSEPPARKPLTDDEINKALFKAGFSLEFINDTDLRVARAIDLYLLQQENE